MIELHVRSKVQPIFNYTGKLVAPFCTPNSLTLIAFLTGCTAGIAFAYNYVWAGLSLLWISGLCDVLDGTVARLTNNAQAIGAYFDLIADLMVEVAVIFGFAYQYPQDMWAYLLFFAALILHFSTFVMAGALMQNSGVKSMYHDHSIIERAEAFIVFSLCALLPANRFYFLISFDLLIIFDALLRLYRINKHYND